MADPAAVAARHTHKRCPDCRRVLPAEAFYRRPDGYLSAYCKAHQLERGRAWRQRYRPPRQRRRAPAKGADNHRVPAAPLLAAVRRYGKQRRLPLRDLLGPELFAAYGNAHQAGTVSLIVLERFCDEVLGWHPRMLYGDAYDRAALSTNGKRPKATHDQEADR
jgi:hypothetical protein